MLFGHDLGHDCLWLCTCHVLKLAYLLIRLKKLFDISPSFFFCVTATSSAVPFIVGDYSGIFVSSQCRFSSASSCRPRVDLVKVCKNQHKPIGRSCHHGSNFCDDFMSSADPGNQFCFRCTVSNSSADFREFPLEPSNNSKWLLYVHVFGKEYPTFVPYTISPSFHVFVFFGTMARATLSR